MGCFWWRNVLALSDNSGSCFFPVTLPLYPKTERELCLASSGSRDDFGACSRHQSLRCIATKLYPTPGAFLESGDRPTAILPIYNEEYLTAPAVLQDISRIQERYADAVLFNSPNLARRIASKAETNVLLRNAGIPVPTMVHSPGATQVFSAQASGSHQPVFIVDAGLSLDQGRYNTEMVDTRRSFAGSTYHVCLRALAVGGEMVLAYPRARLAVDGGDPSVHNADTPLDPALIAWLYGTTIEANRDRLVALCQTLGEVLGPGLFAHDILPAADGELLVCETGFKFEDHSLRKHLWPISPELPFLHELFDVSFATRAADALSKQIRACHRTAN